MNNNLTELVYIIDASGFIVVAQTHYSEALNNISTDIYMKQYI